MAIVANDVEEPEIEQTDQPAPALRLTVGHGLLLLILAGAGVLRLSALDALPLSPGEAEQALAVWRTWQPGTDASALAAVSPAYFSLTALLLPILGHSDAVMRLVPAFFGLALVALPWLWRSRLGTIGALTAAALLAVSPTVTAVSVTAGGRAPALVAVLLLLIAGMRYRESGRLRWLAAAFAAVALGLAAGPLFYSGLATLGAAWLLQNRLRPDDTPSSDGRGPLPTNLTRALVPALFLFLALATLFLWRPAGLGAAATQLAQWMARFEVRGGIAALLAPLATLGHYEMIAVTLGAAATIWAVWHNRPLPLFLAFWFAAALLLMLLQQGVRENVVILVLPATLLIGLWLDRTFSRAGGMESRALALLIVLAGLAAYVNAGRYLRLVPASGQGATEALSFLFLALAAVAAGAVAVNFVRSWNPTAALQGTLAGLLLLALVYNWGTARWLTRQGANDPRAAWTAVGTDEDVMLLTQTLQELSWQTAGSPHGIGVLAGLESPVLRWYLREFQDLQMGQTIPTGSQRQAIIAPAGQEPALGSDYVGTDLGLLHTGAAPPETGAPSFLDTLRWWFFHERPETIERERIVLWIRNDVLE